MNPWHDLEPGSAKDLLAVIEIGVGMRTKYELDKDTGLVRLVRILHGAVRYPVNYGIVPRTLSIDGDPLDILVVTDESLLPGCIVATRLIGLLKMADHEGADDKLLAVPLRDPEAEDLQGPDDLNGAFKKELAHFFEVYTDLEGKTVRVPGYADRAAAEAALKAAKSRYKAAFKKPKKK